MTCGEGNCPRNSPATMIAPGNSTTGERFSHAVLYGKDPLNGDDDDTDLPEPGSLALLGLGLLGLGLNRRRKS